MLNAVNEEDMTTLSKHVDKATAIRGHYKFKHAAVRILMKAGGFSEGIYENHFNWEGAYIQGRQLATVDLIQAKWPGMWEHFCEAVFPGLLDFKALVDSRGKHNLTDSGRGQEAQSRHSITKQKAAEAAAGRTACRLSVLLSYFDVVSATALFRPV